MGILIPALIVGIAQLNATPTTDDCAAGTGCIRTPDGQKGVIDFFANFDVDTHTSQGQVTYTDSRFSVTSNQLIDYAEPEGEGGYRILTFALNDANYPDYNQIRIVVEDNGGAIDDTFEVQLQGTPYYAVSGNVLPDCGVGIAISQDCGNGGTTGGTTGSTTGSTTGGTTGSSTGGSTGCVCPGGGSPPPVSDCDDFVTGGGWILGPDGSKDNFGVHAGVRHGLWGGLNYLDHKTRMHVKSTAVTSYSHISEVGRQIGYNVTINGAPGTAIVTVYDNGEPGRDDTFSITLSNGYTASGDLGGSRPGGGNLQLHKAHCGKDKDEHGNSGKNDEDKNKGKSGYHQESNGKAFHFQAKTIRRR
jgi:hypothetical protein